MRLPTAGEVYGVPTQRVIEIPDIHQPAVESVQEIGLQPILAAAVQCSTQERRSTPRKRHIVVDTLGLLVVVLVTAASVQGPRRRCPSAGPGEDGDALPRTDLRRRRLRRTAGRLRPPNAAHRRARRAQTRRAHGFTVLLRRPVVERTLSWLTAHRRRARDYERLPEHSEAWVKCAHDRPRDPPAGPHTRRKPWQ